MSTRKRSISLQLLISGAMVVCLLVLGGALAFLGYRGIERGLIAAAGDTAHQVGSTINERVQRLINPAQSALLLLRHDQLSKATDLPARLARLPLLAETLRANPMLSAVYAGYPNGDFLLLRTLHRDEVRGRLGAPAGAAWLVQTITHDGAGVPEGAWRFYDAALTELSATVRPDYRYDPRTRPWFADAMRADAATILTDPYVFFTTREVGVTLAQRSLDGAAVLGMDASVNDLSGEVGDLRITGGTQMAVVNGKGEVIAYPALERVIVADGDRLRLSTLDELGVDALRRLQELPAGRVPVRFDVDGRDWFGIRVPLTSFAAQRLQVLMAIPADELLVGARRVLWSQAMWALPLMLLLLLIGWGTAYRISRPLRILSGQVGALAGFDFGSPAGTSSHLTEVKELSAVLKRMSRTIHNFQEITLTLSTETQLDRMLDGVLHRLVEASGLVRGAIYLRDEQQDALVLSAQYCGEAGRGSGDGLQQYPESLRLAAGPQQDVTAAAVAKLSQLPGSLVVPLHDRSQHLLGVLALQLDAEHRSAGAVHAPFRKFVEELSGAAAVAIETRQLIESQQRLLDAIIKLLADAIDAKSPYTGGHCERVPELALLLLDQVVASGSGPFAGFTMDPLQRYEFQVAAWLHDCGKITSSEYVVDKATKLETLYNRIHEVRTRFEVLWRDAELAFWRGCDAGGDPVALRAAMERQQQELRDEFAVVAAANIGGEQLGDEAVDRLRAIGERRWQRNFDDRIGLSNDERTRLAEVLAVALPATEALLADRPEHRVGWGARRPPVERTDPRNVWGFDMQVPQYASNLGELHNLTVRRGTLTEEERFQIGQHIVQTIIMLQGLPLPRHLKRVPVIAGSHHERIDGAGYPRRLGQAEMGIPERVMAIADVFEALTAADRPYKSPKPLSEAVGILVQMACDGHLDPALLRLFLESGAYRAYAERYLRPAQLDEFDLAPLLGRLTANPSPPAPLPQGEGRKAPSV